MVSASIALFAAFDEGHQRDFTRDPEIPAWIADVLLYLMELAHVHGIDLAEAVMVKLNANQRREW